MTDDIPSLAEATAENRRLRVAFDQQLIAGRELLTEIQRLRARILELEAVFVRAAGTMRAIQGGTLEPPPAEDEPARYSHNVLPSAPPHGE